MSPLCNAVVVPAKPIDEPQVPASQPATQPRATPASTAIADEEVAAVDHDGNRVRLPSPPAEMAELIKRGKARFEFYDPKRETRSFTGETRFEYQYRFDSQSDWKRTMTDGKPALEVSIRYRSITLEMQHVISLPEPMIGDDLFEQTLTKHEFDHLRISCDARLPDLLKRMLQERNRRLVKVLDAEEDEFSGTPTKADLSRISSQMVKDASEQVFRDFVATVSIRYRELDRVSDYGRKPMTEQDRQRIIEAAPSAPAAPAAAPAVPAEP